MNNASRLPHAPTGAPLTPLRGAGLTLLLTAGLLLAAACDQERSETPDRRIAHASTATVVDSIFPVEEEIRRFLQTLPEQVPELSGGETSRDALVERFVRSLEAADTTDLARMAMSRGEFGYLYYPSSRYTERPYRLGPALVWYQNQNVGGRGFTRLLRRYAGQDMQFVSYACPEDPEVEGENRFWHRCAVRHLFEGDTVDVQLFGSIWEREGRFKLVGYANAF
jgi:hypothetical protein